MIILNRPEKILAGLLAGAVTAILTVFIALSVFNYPSADDFCIAASARDLGFFKALVFWYAHWSGRYTLHSVWTLILTPQDIFQIYRITPIVLLVLTWLSFSFLIARITQGRLSTGFSLLLGGVGAVLFIAGIPDVAQTFYWMGGSITYQLANILLLFLLGLLVWRETTAKDHWLQTLIFWLASFLAAAIIGTNEVSLSLTLVILGCGTFYTLRARKDSRLFWIGLLVIASGVAIISLLAPGNIQRQASIDSAHDSMLRPGPWLAAVLYLPWVALRILYWLSNLGLWVSAFILLVTTFNIAKARLYVQGTFRKGFLIFPAIWISLIFALSAIGFLINRYPLPERAESVVYLLFLLGWYPSFIILGHFLVRDRIQCDGRRLILPAAALLLINLAGTPNVFEAYKDMYRGYRYSQEMQKRLDTIQAAKNQGVTDMVVASLSHPPRTLFATDIATDPHNFRNECTRAYYQFKSIRLGDTVSPY